MVIVLFFFKSSLSVFYFVDFAFIVIGKNLSEFNILKVFPFFSHKNFVILALTF